LEKVIIEKSVMDYFDGLIFKLFEEEYFGFLDASLNYVDKILDFLLKDLPDTPHKISPSELLFTKPITPLLGLYFLKSKKINS